MNVAIFVVEQNKPEVRFLLVILPFALIHCDLWGYYKLLHLVVATIFCAIVDDYSRAIWVYLLKDKIEVYEKLVSFYSMVNTQFDLKVQRIHSDNGREFMNDIFHTYFLEHGII